MAEAVGCPKAILIQSVAELDFDWLDGVKTLGVTAGASAPEGLVQEVIERLRSLGATSVRTLEGAQERVNFPLPRGLHAAA